MPIGASAHDPAIAGTAHGRVEGLVSGRVMTFKGIPYARAARFMPPEAPLPWTGVRPAQQFGASAPQTNASPPPGPPYVILPQIPRAPDAPPPAPPPAESEDCQYLNVWTSALRDGGKRPVMVWLHGGFFYGGSGSTVDGSALAARGDVVVVSLNHRLNAFGFTNLADYGAEFAYSGNAGMLDIMAALKWIKANIEEFGGDPERVLVFGTSGGGMKTAFLMASPAAEGLFHRAAAQSGPGLRFMEADQSRAVTAMLFKQLGLKEGDVGPLITMPTAQLLAGYHAVAEQMKPQRFIDLPCFAPVIDPDLLPSHPFSPDAAPLTRDIPMILGWNAQEMTFFMGNDAAGFALDPAALEERMTHLFGRGAGNLLALYSELLPNASPSQLWIQANSDYSLMLPTIALAERRLAARSAPTWLYRLDFQSPALGGKLGALHTMEGNLLFDQPALGRALLGDGPEPERLAKQMSSAWVNFAATGDPNGGEELALWPHFEGTDRAALLFDRECRTVSDPQRRILEALRPYLQA